MVVDLFGPFLIPGVLFILGLVGYMVVVLLNRFWNGEDYRAE